MKKVCAHCGREGHLANECTWPRKGNVKLSAETVREIRSLIEKREALLLELHHYTDKGIARRFDVSYQTIRAIRLGEIWVDV